MSRKELCFICDKETDKAGYHEDSLYDADGKGPYCEDCWSEAEKSYIEACSKINDLRRELAAAKQNTARLEWYFAQHIWKVVRRETDGSYYDLLQLNKRGLYIHHSSYRSSREAIDTAMKDVSCE